MRILFAEDEIDIATSKVQLESRQHIVTVATNGQQCFDVFQDNRDFDLAISDYKLPGMNGIQVVIFFGMIEDDIFYRDLNQLNKQKNWILALDIKNKEIDPFVFAAERILRKRNE